MKVISEKPELCGHAGPRFSLSEAPNSTLKSHGAAAQVWSGQQTAPYPLRLEDNRDGGSALRKFYSNLTQSFCLLNLTVYNMGRVFYMSHVFISS